MFSNRKNDLVSYTDGIFSHYAASTICANDNIQSDLIAFLSVVQRGKVDFLPIMWQPALGTVSRGGSGTIYQSAFNHDLSLAFKQYHGSCNDDGYFLAMISEVLILSQPTIAKHPNIINLEGVCWEIKSETNEAVPVLVFEKAAWDLKQFINTEESMNLSIDDRLKICSDIGNALLTLHAYNVVHGDIKPQNILVFKDDGRITIKVADFGYSTLAAGVAGNVFLPRSRPWNAPEYRFSAFTVPEAKKTDVYSFGLLCFWVLFGNRLSDVTTLNISEGNTEQLSFEILSEHHGPTLLESLKTQDKMVAIADELTESMPDLSDEHKIHLKQFFSLTLAYKPDDRMADIAQLVNLLIPQGTALNCITTRQSGAAELPSLSEDSKLAKILTLYLDSSISLPSCSIGRSEAAETPSLGIDFQISKSLAHFIEFHYVVRSQIKDSLEKCYFRNQHQLCASNIALQVAFCYRIGFGIGADDDQTQFWLDRAGKRQYDLEVEKKSVQQLCWNNRRIRKIIDEGRLQIFDLRHEYRSRDTGVKTLKAARKETEKEASDMAREFGVVHFIPIRLKIILGDLMDELGEFEEAKLLRMGIRDETLNAYGADHPVHLNSLFARSHKILEEWNEAQALQEAGIRGFGDTTDFVGSATADLASIYRGQGRWKEAEDIEKKAIDMCMKELGAENPVTLNRIGNLAVTLAKQGRWKEAEMLQAQIMETNKKVLGQDHPDTLVSMGNLAETFWRQGRLKEAEMLEVVVVATRTKVLSDEHPATLASKANLASTYTNQGRWTEAEELEVQVMETSVKVLGPEHPDTLTSMNNLASTFVKQGRWKEAENLLVQIVEIEKKALGKEHPSILISIANLASTYTEQGRWEEAEELEVQVMETSQRVLGQEHPNTLTSISNLASTFSDQGRWKEAEELEVRVVETKHRVLGKDHPSTLLSMANLGLTYRDQGRLKKAEEIEEQVLEKRLMVLGKDHPDTLEAMSNLAVTYSYQGRWKKAEELEVNVMDTRRRVLGIDHPNTLTSMANLASTYGDQERWQEAEELLVQVIEKRLIVLGPEHPDNLTSMNDLAVIFSNQRKWKEAEKLFVQVVEASPKVLGEVHPETLSCMANLASTYLNQGRLSAAEELEDRIFQIRKKVLGQEHPDSLASMNTLARTRKLQGRIPEAIAMMEEVIALRSHELGTEHPDTQASIGALRQWRDEAGRHSNDFSEDVASRTPSILP
ncbi:hypothetical protein BDD12DRAFT_896064 [Trichophaea hybrida]|nr:hypothetical protein BDD12DRAFT_896064 [Trichophaea hybrida]